MKDITHHSSSLFNIQINQHAQNNQFKGSKKVSRNPIFNKLNKIFLQPKKNLQNQNPNQGLSLNQNTINYQPKQDNFNHQKFISKLNNHQFVTAETQPSTVFFPENSQPLASYNNQHSPSTDVHKRQNTLISRKVYQQGQTMFDFDQFFKLNKLKDKKKNRYDIKQEHNMFFQQIHPVKFSYQNHKLAKMHKPELLNSISYEQPKLVPENQIMNTSQKIEAQFSSVGLPLKCSALQQKHQINELQQKVEYYEKMQEFYLDQIQTYRQDKKMLEWKLQLIVEELLLLTMRQKIMKGSTKNTQSQALIKDSKQFFIPKMNEINLSKKLSSFIQNKENIFEDNEYGRNQLHPKNIKQLNLKLSHSLQRLPRNQSYCHTSEHHISSFRLDNVTLVESQDEYEETQYSNQIQRVQKLSTSTYQSIREPYKLIFE